MMSQDLVAHSPEAKAFWKRLLVDPQEVERILREASQPLYMTHAVLSPSSVLLDLYAFSIDGRAQMMSQYGCARGAV
jgi:hypothetical protein